VPAGIAVPDEIAGAGRSRGERCFTFLNNADCNAEQRDERDKLPIAFLARGPQGPNLDGTGYGGFDLT